MSDVQVFNLLQVSQNLQCIRQRHEPAILSRACLNKDCQFSRLMCVNCENDHILHREDTFQFHDIQSFKDEKIPSMINNIAEQLNQLLQQLEKSIRLIIKDLQQMEIQFSSLFPQIDNTSYNGIKEYIDIIVQNIQLRDQKIVFKGYSQIFSFIKQNLGSLSVTMKKISDSIENIIYSKDDLMPMDPKQPIPIQQSYVQIIRNNQEDISLEQISQKFQCSYHQFDQIDHVCLSQQCKMEARLFCQKCIMKHVEHRGFCIPIKEFDEECAQFTLDNDQRLKINVIKKELDDIVNDLNQDFLNILRPNQFIKMYLRKNKIQNFDDLNTAIIQLSNYVSIDDKEVLKFQLSDENTLNLYIHSKFKNCAWNMYDLIKKQEPFFETTRQDKNELKQQLVPNNDEMKQQPIFDKQNCSYSIDIENFKIVKKNKNTNTYDVALINKDIRPKESKSYVFRINKCEGLIGIGFVNATLISQRHFILTKNLSQLGNGVFMIAYSPEKLGKSYHDKDKNQNNQKIAIKFEKGHQYKLKYNPFNDGKQFSLKHITNTKFKEEIKMPMVIEIKELYYPFIMIQLQDDEVELLES